VGGGEDLTNAGDDEVHGTNSEGDERPARGGEL